MRLRGVLGEELSIVGVGNGKPVEIAVGIKIGEAKCVVELLFAQRGEVGNIVATEEQRGGERDIVHEAGMVVPLNHLLKTAALLDVRPFHCWIGFAC